MKLENNYTSTASKLFDNMDVLKNIQERLDALEKK